VVSNYPPIRGIIFDSKKFLNPLATANSDAMPIHNKGASLNDLRMFKKCDSTPFKTTS
jgi:hypothetical protein